MMKRIMIVCFLVAAAVPAAAHLEEHGAIHSKEAVSVAPSAAAVELARELAPATFWALARTTPEKAASQLERILLHSQFIPQGPSCDPRNEACAAAARQVARKHAEAFAKFRNDLVDRVYARLFEAKMTATEIESALAFIRTDEGQALASALQIPTGEDDARLWKSIVSGPDIHRADSPEGIYEEFRALTKDLPRRPLRVAPPPITMPSKREQ